MKHKSTIFANGLHTPPCGSSHGNLSSFRFRNSLLMPLLVLFLLMVGSSAVWGASVDCSFAQGETIYFRLNSGVGWGDASAYPAAVFYYSSDSRKDTKTNSTNWDDMSGSCNIGSGNYTTLTSLGDNRWSVTIPRSDIGYIRIVRIAGNDANWTWNNQSKMCVTDAGTNNCIYCSGWDNTGTWETYGGGRTNTCGGAPAGDTFQGGEVFYMKQNTICTDGNSHDFLKYGRCDFNLYDEGGTFLDKALSAQVIPGTDPVMLKFVVPAEYAGTVWGKVKVKQLETGGAGHNETNKGAIPKDGKNYLINGNTMEWGTYTPPTPYTGNLYLIGGTCTGQNWGLGNAVLLDNDGHGIYTITRQINAVTGNSSDGFKFIESNGNWDSQWRPTPANATVSLSDESKAQEVAPGQTNIVIKKNPGSPDTKWHLTTSGTYTITIDLSDRDNGKMSIEAVPETPHTGDKFYIMGSHNSWCKNCDEHKMTVVDGEYAYKTYENITNNWDFKVAKEDGTELGWSYFSQSKSDYTCTEVPATISNIRPNSYSGAKNLTIYWDGSNVYVHVEDYIAPVTNYTVTIHPNGGSAVNPLSVGAGNTISSISSTYGNGTAKWYTDEELTQEFVLGTSTVDDNMDLYAKWGVSGNYYIGGDMWMHEKNGNNWAYYSTMAMTTTDGVASVTYIAPKGRNRFEILTTRSNWATIPNQDGGLIAASTPTLSWAKYGPDNNNHFVFDLDAPKKVTIRYNGKVSVTAEDYDVVKTGWTVVSPTLFGHGSDDNADYADNNTFMSGYNMTEGQMDANGERTFLNVAPGTYKFWIGKYNTNLDKTKQQIEVFGAANVDIANSSLTGYGSLADVNNAHINRNIPQDDKLHRRVQFTLTQTASIKIAFDGGKITVNLLPKYTVTFNSNDGSAVASQSVFEGLTASEPSAPTKAGYEFVKWQLSGADYNFSNPVTGNITLDAVWAYKAISSVELNESEYTTWVGNSDFVLTLTKNPSDLITKTVEWSSDASGVASVDNGTVHAAGVGTATITCTVTDMFDHVESASCEVSVAACEMTTDNLYSMTVTGYNSSTGSSATLNGLWNESSDNDGPEYPIVKLKLFNNYYVYDDNGTVKMSTDASLAAAQWYEIPTNENFSPDWTGSSFALYEFKNVSTGKYLRRGAGRYGDNGDWYYYTTLADNRETDGNIYKFFYDNTLNTHLVCREGVNSTLRQSYAIHNNNLNWAAGYSAHCAAPMVVCGYTNDPEHNAYTWLHERVLVSAAAANFIHSQMNSSYYRMKADATVRANLANGLAYGSVITVRLYADAATSVKLQTAAGDDVETIDLNADAVREFTYTVAYGSELVGETAFVIKAADNHAGIASIEVSRMHAVSPADPALTWDANLSGGVTQSALAGTFQHVASSALSLGAIHYTSSNEAVATVAANGTVTPIMAGNTTITATIEQRECYAEASITYDVTLTEPTLAELIAADAGAGITLTHDYAENIVINKAITINGGGHSIGNLKVENEGDLTLSSALTVADFTICAKAGNTTTPAASGQVRNATNLTVNGEAYFLYTVDPSGHVQYGWYDFTVPFRVDVMTGIAGIDENSVLKEDFVNERDYAIMEHLGEKQANGEYSYKKFRGIMQPNKLYSITLDNDYNYNTIRFQKTSDGALVASNEVPLNTYASTVDDKHANWNGVGNGTLHHADAGLSVKYVQVYQSGDKTFKPYDKNDISLVVGTAFMVQQAGGTMTLNQASHGELRAPARQSDDQRPAISIQIAREGKPFSDQLFITANEDAQPTYTPGVDVAKAGNIGNVNVPQIWTNAYNSKLCAHESQLINGEAQYALSLYAPANGSYTLTSTSIPAGTTLYLTQNDHIIWDMSENYTFDLNKGTTTEYGLLLVQSHKIPTGIENGEWTNDEGRKVLHNGILYILHNGKVFNAQGAMMK